MKPEARPELIRYATGAVLSAALTGLAFWLVMDSAWPKGRIMAATGGLALIQLGVQLRCFLHIGWNQKREDLQLIAFSAMLLALMIGGTVWIMASLATRMH